MNDTLPDVAATQQDILRALRSGAIFFTAHKEGGTTISWQGGRFIRQDYGDWDGHEQYTDETAFLAFLRRFFNWESCSPPYNADTPEVERWRNIRALLQRDGRSPGPVASPFWKVGAFVIAAIVVGLMAWLGQGHFHSTPPRLNVIKGAPGR